MPGADVQTPDAGARTCVLTGVRGATAARQRRPARSSALGSAHLFGNAGALEKTEAGDDAQVAVAGDEESQASRVPPGHSLVVLLTHYGPLPKDLPWPGL